MLPSRSIGEGVVERCLKSAGARSVWLVRLPDGTRRTVKGWPLTLPLLLRAVAGQAQPQRQRRAARRLVAAGIPSPRVRSGPRLVRRDGTTLLEIELDYVDGCTALDVLREGDPTRCRAAGAAVAELLRSMIASRLHNRDLKLSNIVVAPVAATGTAPPTASEHSQSVQRGGIEGGGDAAGSADASRSSSSGVFSQPATTLRAWLIDPVALRRMRRARAETARMLERLAVEPCEAGLAIPPGLRRAVIAAALDGLRSLGVARGGR